MVNRRALIEGLKPEDNIDPDLAEEFITGRKSRPAKTSTRDTAPAQTEAEPPPASPAPASPPATPAATQPSPLIGEARVPIGARVRAKLASDLKRASLQRQLQGIEPYAIQEILEDAITLWLVKNGHAT